MKPIIIYLDYKDVGIVLLSFIIMILIISINGYYKGVRDTRKTINGFVANDLNSYKKIN